MREIGLIVNEYLNTPKFHEIHSWLVEAGKGYGIPIHMYTNGEVLATYPLPVQCENIIREDFVILFWDKDIRLASYFEDMGYLVFNSSQSIQACDDKSLTHRILAQNGIPMPKTMFAPMTYSKIGYTNLDYLNQVMEQLKFPMVVKECFGSFGEQVYLVHSKEELIRQVEDIGAKPMLFQEYISSSHGKDIRIQVVGNHVVAAMYRYSDSEDFRANITNGGKMKPYIPTREQKQLAVESCKLLGLSYGGVDLLFGQNGEPIVCEVNSNAHFKNIYDCTGINVAEHIIQHIVQKVGWDKI